MSSWLVFAAVSMFSLRCTEASGEFAASGFLSNREHHQQVVVSGDTANFPKGRMATPVIIDTDIGSFSDDFWAIAMLLSDTSLDVRYIITSSGDTMAKGKILAKFLTHLGRDDVRIGIGRKTVENKWFLMGADGLLVATDTWTPAAIHNPVMTTWAVATDLSMYKGGCDYDGIGQATSEILSQHGRNLTYLFIGGHANAAEMLRTDPHIFRRTRTRGVLMGGTVSGDSEWNFNLDPAYVRSVLAGFDAPFVATLEVCSLGTMVLGPPMARSHYSTYLGGDSVMAMAMANMQLSLANYGGHREVANGTTDVLFDAVAAYLLTSHGSSAFSVKRMLANTTEKGKIVPTTGGIAINVLTAWNTGSLFEWERILADSISNGHMAA